MRSGIMPENSCEDLKKKAMVFRNAPLEQSDSSGSCFGLDALVVQTAGRSGGLGFPQLTNRKTLVALDNSA